MSVSIMQDYVTNIQKQKYELCYSSFYPLYRLQIQKDWSINLGEGWLPDINIACFLVAKHAESYTRDASEDKMTLQ